ncbi:peptidoglycan DD-metalloendopeptidase family protein [Candidatus Dependentiae bacterium]|nr:peptidoglycan DD-metalloendopeptidase family protein [Candidatus Dependentiae bacterium]
MQKRINVLILLILSALLIIIAVIWKSEPIEVHAYNMITSQEIIDSDLLLDRTISKIDEISLVRIDESVQHDADDDLYEPTSLDEAKEIITYAPKIEKKEKAQYFTSRQHIVNEGESLWAISKNYDVSVETIIAYNNLKTRQIAVGQKLMIPSMDGILVKVGKGDTLKSIADKFKVSSGDLQKVNRITVKTGLKAGESIFIPGSKPLMLSKIAAKVPAVPKKKTVSGISFIWPSATKNISSPYGFRMHPIYNRKIFHQGLDISGPIGTKIYASEEGRVYFRDFIRGYGKVIILKHNQGYSTVYTHLSKFNIKLGEWVDQGELIGAMGVTGRVTGPHLHFEVRRWDRHIDPMIVLGK